MTERTTVYTDGACSGNPGPGGWAWAVPGGAFAAGHAPDTTNQRMELTAVLEAVRTLSGPLHIRSDSTYVVNCFRDDWWKGWLKRGWTNSKREPVANRDLWEPLIELYQQRDLTFQWVKGHSGDEWNDVVDRLAVEAGANQEDRSGSAPPHEVTPPSPTKSARTGGRDELPTGHRIVVVGHRPPELGGYGENPIATRVREVLIDLIAAKRSLNPDLIVLSGLGLGAETLGAEAALHVAVPLVTVLAYPDFDGPWPAESRTRFQHLIAESELTITLQRKRPDSRQQAGAAIARRDSWLAEQADEAIVVWDRTDTRIGRTVKTLESTLDEANVWILDPTEV